MDKSSYITTYKGKFLYLVSYQDYVRKYKEGTLGADIMYIIADKDNMLIDDKGLVVGRTINGHTQLVPAQGKKKSWKEVFGYKEETIISERPTVEALSNEGANKLKEIINSGEEALSRVAKIGEEVLAAQVAEGNRVVAEVAQRKPRPRKRKMVEGV